MDLIHSIFRSHLPFSLLQQEVRLCGYVEGVGGIIHPGGGDFEVEGVSTSTVRPTPEILATPEIWACLVSDL
jgi:hypothetical protein